MLRKQETNHISSPAKYEAELNGMMVEQMEAKYSIEIRMPDKPIPVSKELVQDLKGAAGGKLLARMKKEALDCPVKKKTVSFVECFGCKNFLRRVKGTVGCKGEQ